MKLKEITICGIRGFNNPQTIQMENDRVIVYGDNGTGKSSIVEALEWLLYGEISRKVLSGCKSEYKGDYIKNKHYSGKANPFVEAIFMKTDNTTLSLKREYASISSTQTFVNGKNKTFSKLGLISDISCKPIMSQAEVKGFAESQRKDKWTEILRMIGLEILDKFREDLSHVLSNQKKSRQFVDSRSFYEEILKELKKYPNNEKLRSNIEKRPYNEQAIIQSIVELLKINNVKSVSVTDLKKHIKNEMEKIIQPENVSILDIPTNSFLTTSHHEYISKMNSVQKIFAEREEFDKEFLDFISTGLKYVSDSICPFCKEKTLTQTRKNELKELVNVSKKKLDLENQLEELLEDQKNKLEQIVHDLEFFLFRRSQLPEVIKLLSKTGQYSEEVFKLSEITKLIELKIEKRVKLFANNLKKYLTLCENYFSKKQKFDSSELEKQKQIIESDIRNVLKIVTETSSELAKIRQNVLPKTVLANENMERMRHLLCLERLLLKKDMIQIYVTCQKKMKLLEKLCKDLVNFEKIKAEQLLKGLSEDVKNYYNILNPNEKITFSEMKPSTGKSRWLIINGESYGEDLNPISCFSEAHLNCLGLSLYFTQRVDKNPFWKLVILDDPVQSMDNNHSSNLVDIVADTCSKGTQVIVLSHQKMFVEVLKRKFHYDDFLYYTFSMRSKNGPSITLTKGTLENYLQHAKMLSSSGSQDEINDGGVNLRKAIEKFCFNFLTIKHNRSLKKMHKLGLEEFFVELERISSFKKQDIADLRTIRSTVDVGAHGNVITDVAKGDLDRGIKIVEKMKQQYL